MSSFLRTTLAAAMLCAAVTACSGNTDSESSTTPKPAAITVRFTNPTSGDVYVNLSLGLPWSVSDGTTVYDRPHDCTSSCSQGCSCAQCGAPAPRVQRIPAGQAIEVVWAGDYYEDKSCGSGGPGCHCDQEHTAAFGSYEISLSGALGYTPGGIGGTSTDPNVLSGDLDPSAGNCVATVTAVLDGEAKTVDAPFACSSP
jgi:hypothetical protein